MKNHCYFHNPAPLADTVDLGLPSGTLWAKCNLGANTETDYGDYFMWGSTTPNTNTPCDWEHAPFNGGASRFDWDYFNAHKAEWLDANGKLKPQYDAAHVIMGGNWRMPTKADFEELLRYTTNVWVENYQGSGVNGRLFISKVNDKTLFFPATSGRCGSSFSGRDMYGGFWGSLLYTDDLANAWVLGFDWDNCIMSNLTFRYYGFSVRGVYNKK